MSPSTTKYIYTNITLTYNTVNIHKMVQSDRFQPIAITCMYVKKE